ncbi:hypothetical protein VOLCADRAFT_106985 [Volvox carteri f. nagariensis]|uniref:Sugar phosphate transporter domain-containing protein n=1 Tax=Volvox carteri f. nagariensis TaxID=3068 RepID=D8UB59_VOLCA|nr:uncharacterized protein VOLCADRAFT_106985 [Volvox carteri f. nagariensis]EFJ43115.1 hypothetical protein VOLCADRAFT_106985 [Volvox carteri f. nagariensis]|eukprot:XP_002955914.1 hypothetical protein VOLCADRAFT_106985 [Volvox carteri f. nagariensis]
MGQLLNSANLKALTYGIMNVISASGIVFANKAVFQTYGFHFTYALTWIHTVFTLVGMRVFAAAGMFPVKPISQRRLVPLAAAYVAYIVLCNLSLKVNTVGFYQVMKIAVAPTVIGLELVMFRRVPPLRIVASVMVVCLGIGVATVTDTQMVSNLVGIAVGVGATIMTALYQIWAGSKQRELKASSMQLLHAYTPQATLMLGILVPLCEPMGWAVMAAPVPAPGGADGAAALLPPSLPPQRPPGTLLAYHYTPIAVAAILISAVLGLLVSLSTFLVIGATSSLTYNVVGHLKTVIILTGGCLLFGDSMPAKKLLGVCIAMGGIAWYTQQKLASSKAPGAASGDPTPAPIRTPLLPITGTASSNPPITVKSVYTASVARTARRGGSGGISGAPHGQQQHHSHRQ